MKDAETCILGALKEVEVHLLGTIKQVSHYTKLWKDL